MQAIDKSIISSLVSQNLVLGVVGRLLIRWSVVTME